MLPLDGSQREEKQRQIQTYLASHRRERERQTRMEHMGISETGSKLLATVGRCSGLVCLLAQGNLTLTLSLHVYLSVIDTRVHHSVFHVTEETISVAHVFGPHSCFNLAWNG